MINVSKEFKEKIEYGRFLLYLTITLADGTVLNLDDSNIWEGGFKIDEGVTESGEFTIGSCIINKMTVVLHDEDEKLSRQVFDGAQVIPYVGIELDNGSIEKIPKGVYEVDSTSYDGDLITLECLDNMHKLDKEYAGVTTTYPATIQTIVTDLCTYCGVVLQSARFDGYNVKLTKRPTNSGITCRQVLSYAMQMICKFAKCDANGKLIIDWFNQQVFEQNALLDGGIFDDDSPYSSGYEADGGTFSPWNTGYEHSSGTFEDMDAFHHIYTLDTLDVAVEDVIISGVQVTAETEDTENGDTFFYGEEGYVLKISGNPFITKENAANFAEYLGKKLIGLIFRPLDASALPDPTVEAGDIAYISDGPSKSYSALVTNLSFDPDDNMSISCDAESPKKTESQRPTELEQTLAKIRKETPMFGDVGCAQTNAEGVAIIDIDPVFAETISTGTEYQVFLQKEGPGDLWIQEKDESYFVVRGTPELKFSWELKCSQKHFEHLRLEEETQRTMVSKDINNAENDYSDIIDGLVNDYDTEMEELINESN